jgi:hypothetical protein
MLSATMAYFEVSNPLYLKARFGGLSCICACVNSAGMTIAEPQLLLMPGYEQAPPTSMMRKRR